MHIKALLDLLESSRPLLCRLAKQRFSQEELARASEYLRQDGIEADLSLLLDALLSVRTVLAHDTRSAIVFSSLAATPAYAQVTSLSNLTMEQRAEAARQFLARYISHRYAPDKQLRCVLLEQNSETTLFEADPKDHPRLAQALAAGLKDKLTDGTVVLTGAELRRLVKDLLRCDLPNAVVLSYQELTPDLSVSPVSRISL